MSRATRNGAELSKQEMDAGVSVLEAKIRKYRPEVVAVVGKGIWESVFRVKRGRGMKKGEFVYGWQPERMGVVDGDGEDGWEGARVFVATSTSGLAATLRPKEKEEIWKVLGDWVQERRREMKLEDGRTDGRVKEEDPEEKIMEENVKVEESV